MTSHIKSIALATLAFLLLVIVSWRSLFFHGFVPVDGNMARMGYPNWSLCRTYSETNTSLLWNPYRNMGEPFLADPQTMAGYPVQRLLLATQINFLAFMRLWILLHTLIAAIFMGLLIWRWFRDPYAVAAAVLLVGLNGCFMSRVSLPNHFASAAYLPMVLYFTDRRSPIFLGVSFALQWLAGFPPFSLLTCLCSFMLAAFRGFPSLKSWGLGSLLGCALGAFQILPFLEYLHLSVRSLMLNSSTAIEFSQPLSQLLKIWLLPQWFAIWPDVVGDQAIVSTYVGPVALMLVGMAIWKSQKLEKGLGIVAIVSLLLCLGDGLPGYRQLSFLHIFRFPANWALVSVTCVALLAASGISRLTSQFQKTMALVLLAVDLVIFAQFIRVPWLPPVLLEETPPLAEDLRAKPYPTRIYHPPFFTDQYTRQSWKTVNDFIFMKESLMPSHGIAYGVREVKSYQVLTLKSADHYQRRLLKAGKHSTLVQWAGISTVVSLQPNAESVASQTIVYANSPSPEKPVFIFNRRPGDQVDSVQQRPGYCAAKVTCSSAHCLLVYSEMDYPGWETFVDGVATPHEVFEEAFVSIRINKGQHQVIFQYKSRAFQRGVWVSLTTLLLIIVVLKLDHGSWRRHRRNQSHSPADSKP